MSVTQKLAAFIAETPFDAIPQDVLALGKRLILDTIGNAAGGSVVSGSKSALQTVSDIGGTPTSTVATTGKQTSPPMAAFANVTLASALDGDDTILNVGHIAHVSTWPALALGERASASGRELLAAVVMGYELGARVVRSGPAITRLPDGKLFFGNTGVGSNWTIFPAAAGSARILGFDAERVAHTLGIAGFTATIPTGRRWNKPNWNDLKYNAYAFMAQNAVQGAMLVANGFTGDPDIFDGDARDVKANWWQMAGFPGCNPEEAAALLGNEWLTRKAGFKPYPSCRFTHGPLDGFRKIIAENDIAADEIEAVEIHTGRTVKVFRLDMKVVNTAADAEFSMPHVMALSALRVPVGPEWVSSRYWHDPTVAALREKVECLVWDEANAIVTEQIVANDFVIFPYRVVVRARGASFEAQGNYASGDHDLPETRFGDEQVIAKFRTFAEPGMSASNIDRCIDAVMNLERLEDIRTLTALLN